MLSMTDFGNNIPYIYYIQLFQEGSVFLNYKSLRETVSSLFISRNPFDLDRTVLYLLPYPVLMNIDVLELGDELWRFLD